MNTENFNYEEFDHEESMDIDPGTFRDSITSPNSSSSSIVKTLKVVVHKEYYKKFDDDLNSRYLL